MRKTRRFIFLTRGYVAQVDWDDYDDLSQYRWHAVVAKDNAIYARASSLGHRRDVYLHRYLMKPRKSQVVDHADRDTLDNRRANLRVTTRGLNVANSVPATDKIHSRYKGVTKKGSRWYAGITVKGYSIHLGCYDLESDAAKAYEKAAKVFFGEFARTQA